MRSRLSLAALAVALVGAFLVPHTALGLGHHSARMTGTEHFRVLSSNPSNKAVPVVVATGPIHAKGRDIVLSQHKDKFVFPMGAVIAVHTPTGHHQSHDATTCYTKFTEHGTYRVTRGTGAYAGAHGSGTYHVVVQIVACPNHRPRYFNQQINASGPLTK